jgi:hypothetical protein
MGTVKLASALPKEPDRNGLMAHAAELLRHPDSQRIVIAVVDVRTVEDRRWEGIRVPVLGIHAAELLDDAGAEQARLLMERARDRRQGGTQLPFGGGT